MKYKIVISDKAISMLYRHLSFIARVSQEASLKEKSKIFDAIRKLEESPERYPLLENEYIASNIYHKMLIDKRYFVLYQIKNNIVFVDYIADTREKNSWMKAL